MKEKSGSTAPLFEYLIVVGTERNRSAKYAGVRGPQVVGLTQLESRTNDGAAVFFSFKHRT